MRGSAFCGRPFLAPPRAHRHLLPDVFPPSPLFLKLVGYGLSNCGVFRLFPSFPFLGNHVFSICRPRRGIFPSLRAPPVEKGSDIDNSLFPFPISIISCWGSAGSVLSEAVALPFVEVHSSVCRGWIASDTPPHSPSPNRPGDARLSEQALRVPLPLKIMSDGSA